MTLSRSTSQLLVLAAVVSLSTRLQGTDFTVPTATQALEKVKVFVAESAAKNAKITVWVTVFGKQQKVLLLGADAESFSVDVQKNRFDQKWSKTSISDIYQLGKGCISADPSGSFDVIDYCLATGQLKAAEETIDFAIQNSTLSREDLSQRSKALASLKGDSGKVPAKEGAADGTDKKSPSVPGKMDKATALRDATDFSLAGMHRRFGPDATSYRSNEKFPEIWMAPEKEEKNRKYQIGGPWTKEAGDYSSTQGQILYVPDFGLGVDRVTIIEMSHNCFTEKPLPPWWGGFRPEPASAAWVKAAGGNPGAPIAMARGMVQWANSGVAIFSSGLVGVAGTCTAKGSEPSLMLPRTKIPTAISVTPKNEFALITVVDTEKQQGQVAVIALESSAKKTGFAHEWHEDHPGLPNVAVFTKMKLLGYIDLPGISVPTGISAVGNRGFERVSGADGHAGLLKDIDLSKQGFRDAMYKGGNSGLASSAGFAVVISRSEDKVVFIDLQPLFERMRDMYFTTEENYKKTRDAGSEPKQWPYTFDVDPTMKPTVTAVQTIAQPTAVLATVTGGKKARAIVATLDGKVAIYQVGDLGTDEPAKPQDIGVISTVQVGRNPCSLAYQKHSNDTFMAVCRGDREIVWVKHGEKGKDKDKKESAEVVRRLRDARMIDPVNVEVSDTHGIETFIISVADFKGRKIINYRLSELRFATQGGAKFGMGPDGKDEAECGGYLEFPGSPFCISATNVN